MSEQRGQAPASSRILLLAIAMPFVLLACAAPALATTVAYDGGVFVVTGGDNLNHEVQFRYNAGTGRDEILETQPITSYPVDCTEVSGNTWISCPAHTGGTGRPRRWG